MSYVFLRSDLTAIWRNSNLFWWNKAVFMSMTYTQNESNPLIGSYYNLLVSCMYMYDASKSQDNTIIALKPDNLHSQTCLMAMF